MTTNAILLLAAALSNPPAPQMSSADGQSTVAHAQYLQDADIPPNAERVRVQPLAAIGPALRLQTRVAGTNLTLELQRHSLRSAKFEVLIPGPDGALQPLAIPPAAHTFRGRVREWDCSTVSASFVDGRLIAFVQTLDHGDWCIQPVEPTPAGDHMVFSRDSVSPHGGTCGVTPEQEAEALARRPPQPPRDDGGGNAPRGGTFDTEISFDADFEFFQLNGSSVAATIDDIEAVMVGVDAIYRAEVGIQYVVNRIIVRTSDPDPYSATNRDTLLTQFYDEWNDNHGGQERDVAHLMTGKDIDGNTIGYGSVGVLCDVESAYAFSQSRFSTNMVSRAGLTAHELGHNWGASHCDGAGDCSIMCSIIGACAGNLTQFGVGETNQIVAYRNSASCLGGFNNTVWVNAGNNSGSEDGSPESPYNTLREGLWAASPGGTIVLFGGNYDFDRTASILNRPVTLTKQPGVGTVLIGQ